MIELLGKLRTRFASGNSVPVERAHITRKEWQEIELLLVTLAPWADEEKTAYWSTRNELQVAPQPHDDVEGVGPLCDPEMWVPAMAELASLPDLDETKFADFDVPFGHEGAEQPHGASAGSDETAWLIECDRDGRISYLADENKVGRHANRNGTWWTHLDRFAKRFVSKLDADAFLLASTLPKEHDAWLDGARTAEHMWCTPSQPSCVQDARDGDEPYFVAVDQNGCASCGHDRMWTVVGPDGSAASKSWGDEEEAEWFCECMNEAFAVGQATPPAAITAKPGKGETK